MSRGRTWWGARTDVCPDSPGDYYRPSPGLVGMNEALYSNLLSLLPEDILVKVDRAAMAHGFETRVPFLDRGLVEFTLSLHRESMGQ